jgi:serpin B
MRLCSFFLFSCFTLCFAAFLIPAAPASASADVPEPRTDETAGAAEAFEAAEAVNAFAVDMYRRLAWEAREKDGFFFSPYSISSALAMVSAGADGETAREMAKVLHLTDLRHPHLAMKSLKDRFDALREGAGQGEREKNGVFDVANRVWADAKEELLPSYANLVGLYYGGGLEPLDFEKNAEGARETINAWVARRTRGKVRDLLRAGDVDRKTRLVLTDAVYFSSGWMRPFDEKLTKTEPFRVGRDETKEVPMMRMTASFLYGEETDLQFVKIPYRLPGFSLLILLPRANDAFTQTAELEKKLSARQISDWTAAMAFRSVSLRLPKFRSEGRYLLEKILGELGMKRAFTRDADFSKMVAEPANDDGVLHIDSVIHQAFIELDEKGTEAAAATAVTMTRTTAFRTETPVEFDADRPFVYCLTDDRTGAILFMGRAAGP